MNYHDRTKHYADHYARALGYMDWDTQPDPFRRFHGARLVSLDAFPSGSGPSYGAVFGAADIPAQPVNRNSISQFFYNSLALSAWKAVGSTRWSLRVNPSSGNLHPTEGYLLAGPVHGLTGTAGVFHYAPYEHALEERFALSAEQWKLLRRGLPSGAFLVGLTSIYWREAWKYGERAFRYCQHDVGHGIAALTIAARLLGWRTVLLERPVDASIARLLGTDRQHGTEAEHPECLIAVLPSGITGNGEFAQHWDVPAEVMETLAAVELAGVPNQLSKGHHVWDVIDTVSATATKITPPGDGFWFQRATAAGLRAPEYAELPASRIIRQRRSAQAMDGVTDITRNTFYRMLQSVMPGTNHIVFQTLPWKPSVHLAIFVHRVRGLAPGLYMLVRDPSALALLRDACDSDYSWEEAEACLPGLRLYLLQATDFRAAARVVSCHQEIASDGAFSLGMLAEFDAPLAAYGAWFYKRLFWETGVIGQVLYLEAEVAGIRSTGIGCFFDELMHEILGLQDRSFQSLYHFTVGGAVEDPRLRTQQAYAHLQIDSE